MAVKRSAAVVQIFIMTFAKTVAYHAAGAWQTVDTMATSLLSAFMGNAAGPPLVQTSLEYQTARLRKVADEIQAVGLNISAVPPELLTTLLHPPTQSPASYWSGCRAGAPSLLFVLAGVIVVAAGGRPT